METGLIIRVDARFVQVELGDRVIAATLRGKLFERGRRPVTVGDRVQVSLDGEQATVEEVLERRSVLARQAAGQERRRQVMVANVDFLCVLINT